MTIRLEKDHYYTWLFEWGEKALGEFIYVQAVDEHNAQVVAAPIKALYRRAAWIARDRSDVKEVPKLIVALRGKIISEEDSELE